PATTYFNTLSLHDALPISHRGECLAHATTIDRRAVGRRKLPRHDRLPAAHAVASCSGEVETVGRLQAHAQVADHQLVAIDACARSEENTSQLQSREKLVCR